MEKASVADYFRGGSVFLTGGTGYVGRALLEKLLRACPGLDTAYLLVRPKKGRDPGDRLEHLLGSPLFARALSERPESRSKVVALGGELTLPGLGLSEADRDLLREKVSVVFHCGATVRFNEGLRSATQVNVAGTRDVLELAASMARVQAVVYVSTAFCHCPVPLDQPVEERVYPVPVQPRRLVECAEWMTDEQFEHFALKLREDWANAYSFTKASAEYLVDSYSHRLPVVIFRPSLVLSSWQEPVAGFVDTYTGPGSLLAGGAAGVVRTMLIEPGALADIVPLDLTVNALIVAAWATATNRSTAAKGTTAVYNMVSGPRNPVHWQTMADVVVRTFTEEAPCDEALWCPVWIMSASRARHVLLRTLLHLLPALILDTMYRVRGKTPRLGKFYEKVHQQIDAVEYFMLRDWRFKDANTLALCRSLSTADRELFPCDIETIPWTDMLRTYTFGLRQYLLKQDPSTIPAAKRRMAKLKWAHFSLLFFLWLIAGSLLCVILYKVFSLVL